MMNAPLHAIARAACVVYVVAERPRTDRAFWQPSDKACEMLLAGQERQPARTLAGQERQVAV